MTAGTPEFLSAMIRTNNIRAKTWTDTLDLIDIYSDIAAINLLGGSETYTPYLDLTEYE